MHRYQFTHSGFTVIPFGHRALADTKYTGAAHFEGGSIPGTVHLTINFPQAQFETDREAAKYAETEARAMIDNGKLDR